MMSNITYITEQGDKWDSIAYKVYGSAKYMPQLMAANTGYLEYYIFPAGIELQLPEITTEQAALSSLPPWRQVV
jgi:phage tail protein X